MREHYLYYYMRRVLVLHHTCTIPHRLRRSLSAKRLARLLSKRYHASNCEWSKTRMAEEIAHFDTSATGLAGAVLRHLKGFKALTNRLQCELAQGFAECLRRRGFGVALHVTDAASVREQILDLSRKRFNAVKRKSGMRKATFKASSLASLLSKVQDYVSDDDGDEGDDDGSNDGDADEARAPKRRKGSSGASSSEAGRRTKEAQQYLVGFTIVPPNVMGDGMKDFAPVRSFDMCGKRKRASGVIPPLLLPPPPSPSTAHKR